MSNKTNETIPNVGDEPSDDKEKGKNEPSKPPEDPEIRENTNAVARIFKKILEDREKELDKQ